MTTLFFRFSVFRVASGVLAVLASTLFSPVAAYAAVATWDGSIDGNWASIGGADSNWVGGVGTNGQPSSGDSLVFTSATGSGGVSLVDNLMTPGTFNVAGITFSAGSPAYTISPGTPGTNGFNLAGNILNSSTNLQTINDLITMTAVRTITMTAGGGNVTLGGNISGTGGGITAAGNGTLTLSGTNSYTGTTTMAANTTIHINSGSALGTGTFAMNGGTVDAIGMDRSLPNAVTLGGNFAFEGTNNLTLGAASLTGSRTITLNSTTGKTLSLGVLSNSGDAARTLTVNGAGNTLTLAGWNLVTGGSTTRLQTVNGSGNITINGAITNGTSTAAQNLILSSFTGVMTLNGANTYTGTTQINNATVILNGSMASTALLRVVGTSTAPTTLHLTGMVPTNPLPANLSELRLGQAGVGVGKLILGGANGPVDQTVLRLTESSGSSNGNNSVVGGANSMSILTLNNTTTEAFNSRIGGDGTNENNIGITKAGSGTWTLTANSTYSGPTTVQGGTLTVSGTGSINGTSGVTINGSDAKFLYNSDTAGTVPVNLTMGTVDGTRTIGALSMADNAAALVTNGNAGIGQLTMSSLSFAGDATVEPRSFAATLTPGIVVQGALSTTGANGTVTVTPTSTSGSWIVGNNPLISYGSFTGSISDFTLNTPNTPLSGRQSAFGGLVDTGSSIALQVIGDLPKWTGLDSGNWQVGATGSNKNWQLVTGGTATDYIEGDQVVFDDSATTAVTLSGGTIDIDISAALVTPTTTEFNHSSLNYTVNSSNGFSISGAGLVTKSGTGTLTFNTPNSYTGGTLFTGGTLLLGTSNFNYGNLGNGPVVISPGSVKTLDNISGIPLSLSTTTQTWSDDFTFTGTNDLDMGTGAVTLSGATRTITVNGSRLSVGGLNGGATTALVVNGAGTLAIGNSTVGGLSGTGGISNNAFTNATLTVNQNTDSTFDGALTDASPGIVILGLTKHGTGKLTLTSPNSAYSGTTTLAAGTLVMAHPDALGNSSTHTSRVNVSGESATLVFATDADTSYALGLGMSSGATVDIVSDRTTLGAAVDRTMTTPSGLGNGQINFTSGPNVTSGTGRITFEQFSLAAGSAGTTTVNPTGVNLTLGNVTKTSSSGLQVLGLDGTTSDNEVAGVISTGTAVVAVLKSNTSTWTLSNDNTYTGTTIIEGGTLIVGNGGATGRLGTGSVTNNATLSYNRSDFDLIENHAISGTGALNQIGSGKTTLSAASSYSGPTTIMAGTLAVTGSINNSAVVVSSGTLDGTGSVGPTTVADDALAVIANGNGGLGSLTLDALTFSGDGTVNLTKALNATPLLVTNALTTSANGPVTINGNGSGTWISGLNNLIQFGSFSGSINDFNVGSITGLTSRQNVDSLVLNGNNIALNIIGDIVTWTGNDDGNWSVGLFGANKNWKITSGPTDYVDGDEVVFDDTAPGTTSIDLGSFVSPTSTVFNNSSKNYTLDSMFGTGILTGPLSKSGTGSLTINTANSYTNGTTLSGGTLNLGNASALGTGAFTIGTGNAKTLNNTSGGPLALANDVVQNWNDDFSFTGTNDLNVGAGDVILGGSGVARTVAVNGGILTVGSIKSTVSSGVGLTKSGAGSLVAGASSNNVLEGNVSVTGGSLTFATVTTVAGNVNVSGVGSNLTASQNLTVGGNVSVSAGATATASQIGTIAGDLTVDGTYTIGIQNTTATGLTGSGLVETNANVARLMIVNNVANKLFSGTISNGTNGGTLGLTKQGLGTLTLAGNSTYTGNTTISGGKLVMAHANALGGFANGKLLSIANGGTFEIATDNPGNSDTAYQLTVGSGSEVTIVSNRATPGPGISHPMTTTADPGVSSLGGATINFTSGGNVTSGMGNISFDKLNTSAGAATTIKLVPTTATVTIGTMTKQSVGLADEIFNLDGTSTGNTVNGTIADGPGNGSDLAVISITKTNTSTWALSGDSTYSGGTTVSGGTLLINNVNGSGTGVGPVTVNGGTLGGTGTIDTSTTNANVTVTAGGKLAPGTSAGVLQMDLGSGSLDISGSVAAVNTQSMLFELAAIAASDKIQLTNAATSLNIGSGVLEFDDFAFTNLGGLTAGTYTLFDTSATIIGTLGVSLSGSIGAFSATLGLGDSDNDIVLTVSGGSLPGDFNMDGKVDGADYVVWRKNPAAFLPATYDTWRSNFGNPPGAGSSLPGTGGAVPEPGTFALLCLGGLAVLFTRRGRHA